MHIELDLELQKLNSGITKNLLPQEKDWFLNKEVNKYINQKIDKHSNRKQTGFAETMKRVDDLRELVRVETKIVETNNRGESCITFPSNYLHYIRFDDYLKKECSDVLKIPIKSYTVQGNLNFPTSLLDVYTITLIKEDNSSVVLFDATNLPDGYIVNTEIKKQNFLLRKAIYIELEKNIKKELSPSTSIYWDNLTDFTIISNINFKSINIFRTDEGNIIGNTYTYNSSVETKRQYSTENLPLKSRVRIVNNEFLTDIENSSISKSTPQSPVGSIREDKLILSKCKSAIHGMVDVTYICKPTIIDIYLNSNLNMSRNVCEEIVTNTVRVLKAILQDDNYQTYAQENILIE